MRTLPLMLAATLALAGGCASTTTPYYDARFGDAVRQSTQGMRLHPTPVAAPAPTGADGKAVREATERYLDAFRKPEAPVNVINIGGTAAGSDR